MKNKTNQGRISRNVENLSGIYSDLQSCMQLLTSE